MFSGQRHGVNTFRNFLAPLSQINNNGGNRCDGQREKRALLRPRTNRRERPSERDGAAADLRKCGSTDQPQIMYMDLGVRRICFHFTTLDADHPATPFLTVFPGKALISLWMPASIACAMMTAFSLDHEAAV